MNVCPVCGLRALADSSELPDDRQYNCTNCGTFTLTRTAAVLTLRGRLDNHPRARAVLSHALRVLQRQTPRPHLNSNDVKAILEKGHLPTVPEQADNVIVLLG